MTVAELIEQLESAERDAVIVVQTDCCGCSGADVVVESYADEVLLIDKHRR